MTDLHKPHIRPYIWKDYWLCGPRVDAHLVSSGSGYVDRSPQAAYQGWLEAKGWAWDGGKWVRASD